MSAQKKAGQFVGGIISNPTFVLYFVIAIVIFIIAIRWIRKDKREAKARAKQIEEQLLLAEATKETVVPRAAKVFELEEDSVRICNEVALNINGLLAKGVFKNVDESEVIYQLKRLAGPKTVRCADFFFKQYHKANKSPNIAYDSLSVLNKSEFNQLKDEVKAALLSHARLKGEPDFDIF